MNIAAVAAKYNDCYWSHPEVLVPVWEDLDRCEAGMPPKYLGCKECGEMVKISGY